VAAGFGFCAILIALTLVFAEGIHLFDLAPPLETILAFAPGGQAELTVMALIVGADMAIRGNPRCARLCETLPKPLGLVAHKRLAQGVILGFQPVNNVKMVTIRFHDQICLRALKAPGFDQQ